MTTFNDDHEGKSCPSCGDTMTSQHSNFAPMWSDYHNDVVCSDCFYEGNVIIYECEKLYLIWNTNEYRLVPKLPDGIKLTTKNDNTEGFVVDVSHWDSADFYEFDNAEEGDRVAQLEGLLECEHPIDTWHHHYDPTTTLGDYYTCGVCGELTQVG